jgi:hypothetical protein
MPVPVPSEVAEPSEPTELPLGSFGLMSLGSLLEPRRRPAFLGAVALAGLITGFSVVRSLVPPRSHASEPAAVIGGQAASTESKPAAPVPDPASESAPPAVSEVESPPGAPVAPPPEALAAVAVTTPMPRSTRAAARAAPTTTPAATPTAAKPAATPAPVAAPGGACNPPYRTDFFGKKVPKPGCS